MIYVHLENLFASYMPSAAAAAAGRYRARTGKRPHSSFCSSFAIFLYIFYLPDIFVDDDQSDNRFYLFRNQWYIFIVHRLLDGRTSRVQAGETRTPVAVHFIVERRTSSIVHGTGGVHATYMGIRRAAAA